MMAVLLSLYSFLLALLLVLTAPWWAWQMVRTGKYREGLDERLGRIPARLLRVLGGPSHAGRSAAEQPARIWVHAVSVGEVLAASRLIELLASESSGAVVYVSTTTRTGQTLARDRFGADQVFYFPLDFAFAMRAWLRFLRPSLVVLMESELWPRMLVECRRGAIPVAVVNARISDRSWPRYQRLRGLWRPLLASLALVLAQSEQDARRLRLLGAATAEDAGNLKYDIRVAAPAAATAALRERLPAGAKVVVCGSTLAGEEALLLDSLPLEEIITVLAPRHPERFDSVARLLAERGVPFERRSSWLPAHQEKAESLTPGAVVLLDSVGELASVYSLATLAVMGGGFLWPGGHNPLEPAQFGVPVVMGAQYANFRDVVDALLEEQAVFISDPAGLRDTLASLLADADRRRAIGERGRDVFDRRAGSTARTLAALLSLLAEPAAGAVQTEAVAPGQDGKVPR